MKKLMVPLVDLKPGKIFTEAKRVASNILDSLWNDETVFEEVTLTYTYLSGKVGAYVPTVGASKPTTDKFRAFVKLYALALYFNNIIEIEADTFVFENRWGQTPIPENEGYVIISKMGSPVIRRQAGFETYGIVFKNEEDAVLAIELLGASINDIFI
jgi:hypothetical protein